MSTLVLLTALALVRPVEVLEQWELVSDVPLREAVTARGLYRRGAAGDALLPDAVQGEAQPTAWAVGGRDLPVRRVREGWVVALPEGAADGVRLVARVVRPVPGGAVLFRVGWPRVPFAHVATRRVAEIDRRWLPATGAPPDWTCPGDDDAEVLPCVSTARAASPLVVRIPAAPASRAGLLAAFATLVAVVGTLTLAGARDRRGLRLAGALGGTVCGLAIALAVVGAHALGWVAAVACLAPPLAALGSLATRTEASRAVGAVSLVALPLLVVAEGRVRDVLVAAGVTAVALVALSLRRARATA